MGDQVTTGPFVRLVDGDLELVVGQGVERLVRAPRLALLSSALRYIATIVAPMSAC
jgi:hypothetical protein